MKYLLISFIILLNACSPKYIYKASVQQIEILTKREKISDVLKENDKTKFSSEEFEKLKLVLEVRDFSQTIGLKPKNSYLYYTKLDKENLGYLLMASKKDAFALKTWWFPIVGSVPYKGFTTLEDAKKEAFKLENKDYEVFIRPITAYSTLGWFSDPILSIALKEDTPSLANIVIHEIFHNTFWYKNDVKKNESLANWTGLNGAIDFFKQKIKNSIETHKRIDKEIQENYKKSIYYLEREKFLAKHINKLYEELESLYKNHDLTKQEKLEKKQALFVSTKNIINSKYPELKILKNPNNAELIGLVLYLGEID